MKTVKMYKRKRERLYDYSKYGEKLDDTINRLLDEADLPEPVPDKITNMSVSEDTWLRIKSLKESDETMQDVIIRALDKIKEG